MSPTPPVPLSAFPKAITLRDYFAAAALQGWLSTYSDADHPADHGACDAVARDAFAMADAMLAARERR